MHVAERLRGESASGSGNFDDWGCGDGDYSYLVDFGDSSLTGGGVGLVLRMWWF